MYSGLFLALLPLNHNLLKELASSVCSLTSPYGSNNMCVLVCVCVCRLSIVYTSTSATVKRILLKLFDQPVSTIAGRK